MHIFLGRVDELPDILLTALPLRIPGRLTLDVHPRSASGGVVTVTGEPGEVLLWVYGRDAAHVTLSPEGVEPRAAAL